MEWSEEYVRMDVEDELDTERMEDEVDGVGDGWVLVSTKVQFVNMERMIGSLQLLIIVVVAREWVAAKSLKDMLCSQMVWYMSG